MLCGLLLLWLIKKSKHIWQQIHTHTHSWTTLSCNSKQLPIYTHTPWHQSVLPAQCLWQNENIITFLVFHNYPPSGRGKNDIIWSLQRYLSRRHLAFKSVLLWKMLWNMWCDCSELHSRKRSTKVQQHSRCGKWNAFFYAHFLICASYLEGNL